MRSLRVVRTRAAIAIMRNLRVEGYAQHCLLRAAARLEKQLALEPDDPIVSIGLLTALRDVKRQVRIVRDEPVMWRLSEALEGVVVLLMPDSGDR